MKIHKLNNMKTIIIMLLLFTAAHAQAQTAADRVAVLQQLLDHPQLQAHYATNPDGSAKQRYILQHPTSFSAEVVAALPAETAVILDTEELPAGAANWIRFRSMGISATVASGSMNLFVDAGGDGQAAMLMIHFEVQKSGDTWEVTNINIGG